MRRAWHLRVFLAPVQCSTLTIKKVRREITSEITKEPEIIGILSLSVHLESETSLTK